MNTNTTRLVSFSNVLMYGGTFIAFLIGSGFATGQEVLQYFTSYGYWGVAGTAVMFCIFMYVCSSFILVGNENNFEKPNDIYVYYCGKYIGRFFDYFSVLFIYMSYFVMIAGAGATVKQQYEIPNIYGAVFLALMSAITVSFGLNNMVKILGKIGPIIAIIAISLGIWSIVNNFRGLSEDHEIVYSLPILKASTNWFFSAASYTGFCMLWLAAFVSAIGSKANSKKEGVLGIFVGVAGFSIAVLIVSLGLLANIGTVSNSMVPLLHLAGKINPIFGSVFSVIIIAGIYTTAVPLLWTVSSRIINNDKDSRFIIVTAVLAFIGFFVGLKVPFDKLVNVVYVVNGYVGFLLFFMMIIKSIRRLTKRRESTV